MRTTSGSDGIIERNPRAKVRPDFSESLNLIHALELVFNGIFNRDNLPFGVVDLVERGVEVDVLPEPVGPVTTRYRSQFRTR